MDAYILDTAFAKCMISDGCEMTLTRRIGRYLTTVKVRRTFDLFHKIMSVFVEKGYIEALRISITNLAFSKLIKENVIATLWIQIFEMATKSRRTKIAKAVLERIKDSRDPNVGYTRIADIIAAANPKMIPYLSTYFSKGFYEYFILFNWNHEHLRDKNIIDFVTLNNFEYTLNLQNISEILDSPNYPPKIIDHVYNYKLHRLAFYQLFSKYPEVAKQYLGREIAKKKKEIALLQKQVGEMKDYMAKPNADTHGTIEDSAH